MRMPAFRTLAGREAVTSTATLPLSRLGESELLTSVRQLHPPPLPARFQRSPEAGIKGRGRRRVKAPLPPQAASRAAVAPWVLAT